MAIGISPSIPSRIEALKRLARDYLDMEYAAPIENPSELLRIFDIRGSMHIKHPQKGSTVYISRKSLKHFVEARKNDLGKRHPTEEIFSRIMFALNHVQDVVINYEHYEEDRVRMPPAHFYSKDYSYSDYPQLRILLDEIGEDMEICTIHFRKPGLNA